MTTPIATLTEAVQRYLDLMYTSDPAEFDQVFAASAQLHGLRDGELSLLGAAAFKAMLASRPSPRALGAPREDAILALDLASPDQAVAKVRVRIAATLYLDQLCWHRIDGAWRITAKSFHIERTFASATAL